MIRHNISLSEFTTRLSDGRVDAWLLIALLLILVLGILWRELGEYGARRRKQVSRLETEASVIRRFLSHAEPRKPRP